VERAAARVEAHLAGDRVPEFPGQRAATRRRGDARDAHATVDRTAFLPEKRLRCG
jgi:hypothetical protein